MMCHWLGKHLLAYIQDLGALKSIQCPKGKCKQELMLNPHTPSELLEEKLTMLDWQPHPKKRHPQCALSLDRAVFHESVHPVMLLL